MSVSLVQNAVCTFQARPNYKRRVNREGKGERVEGGEERWKWKERLDEIAYVSNVMRL